MHEDREKLVPREAEAEIGMSKRRKYRPSVRFKVHGVSVTAWTKRYKVEPFSSPCSECARTLTTTLPFVQNGVHGLMAPKCECGNERTPYVVLLEDLAQLGGAPRKS